MTTITTIHRRGLKIIAKNTKTIDDNRALVQVYNWLHDACTKQYTVEMSGDAHCQNIAIRGNGMIFRILVDQEN